MVIMFKTWSFVYEKMWKEVNSTSVAQECLACCVGEGDMSGPRLWKP